MRARIPDVRGEALSHLSGTYRTEFGHTSLWRALEPRCAASRKDLFLALRAQETTLMGLLALNSSRQLWSN